MIDQDRRIITNLTAEFEKTGNHARLEIAQSLKTYLEAMKVRQDVEHDEKTHARNEAFLDRVESRQFHGRKSWSEIADDLASSKAGTVTDEDVTGLPSNLTATGVNAQSDSGVQPVTNEMLEFQAGRNIALKGGVLPDAASDSAIWGHRSVTDAAIHPSDQKREAAMDLERSKLSGARPDWHYSNPIQGTQPSAPALTATSRAEIRGMEGFEEALAPVKEGFTMVPGIGEVSSTGVVLANPVAGYPRSEPSGLIVPPTQDAPSTHHLGDEDLSILSPADPAVIAASHDAAAKETTPAAQ